MTGFVVVDKEQGVSSAREVGVIKRLVHVPCGHMGTLDPMATGVLPVAIGNAARLFEHFKNKKKTYVARFRFGLETDTLDTTGTVLIKGLSIPDGGQIESALGAFVGEILQTPPRYSAKSINGRRGYELARSGTDFTLEPKKVTVYSFKMLERTGADEWAFEIECGGGTYIRSLADDLGKALGTRAVMSGLIRTKSGVFDLTTAVKTKDLTEENIVNHIIPADSILDYPSFRPTEAEGRKIFNGVPVQCGLADGTYKLYTCGGSFYGLAEVNCGVLKTGIKLC